MEMCITSEGLIHWLVDSTGELREKKVMKQYHIRTYDPDM